MEFIQAHFVFVFIAAAIVFGVGAGVLKYAMTKKGKRDSCLVLADSSFFNATSNQPTEERDWAEEIEEEWRLNPLYSNVYATNIWHHDN